jgi:TM2 domain-containing membrane protein YozV
MTTKRGPMPDPTIDLKNRYLAALLAWLIPGLGHFYQGRTGKGILYAVCIISLFLVGLALGDWRIVYWRWTSPVNNSEQFCFNYLGQFWAGLPALPALIQGTLRWYGQDPNFLWGFMAEPTQNEINGLYPGLGKFVEIGTLYTTVAGLLNVLAIYDAFEGPAHVDENEPAPLETRVSTGKPIVIDVEARA